MRLFIAINFDDEVKDKLCKAIDLICQSSAKGNFSRRENLHLTLVFLGEVQPKDVVDVIRSMDTIDSSPFILTIGGIGRFARHGGDICWAGVKLDRHLKDLQRHVAQELAAAGFIFDRREYHPHLTLGREVVLKEEAIRKYREQNDKAENIRGKSQTGSVKQDLIAEWYADSENQRLLPQMAMNVRKISLMQSDRIGGKMVYTELYAKELG